MFVTCLHVGQTEFEFVWGTSLQIRCYLKLHAYSSDNAICCKGATTCLRSSVQCTDLRIIIGSMKSTRVNSLIAENGERSVENKRFL